LNEPRRVDVDEKRWKLTGHGPHRTLTSPVDDLVHSGKDVFCVDADRDNRISGMSRRGEHVEGSPETHQLHSEASPNSTGSIQPERVPSGWWSWKEKSRPS